MKKETKETNTRHKSGKDAKSLVSNWIEVKKIQKQKEEKKLKQETKTNVKVKMIEKLYA